MDRRSTGDCAGNSAKAEGTITAEESQAARVALQAGPKFLQGVYRMGPLDVYSEVLGVGSRGVVFQGAMDGRHVAVKCIPFKEHPDVAEREKRALCRADAHPNIVRCHGATSDSDYRYVVLERCPQTVEDLLLGHRGLLLDRDGLPTDLCMQVLKEVAEGLMALHDNGIIHRNICSENILLTGTLHAKVSSLGLSRRLDRGGSSCETRSPGGSGCWKAPEQLRKTGEKVRQGPALDVFTYGLLINYLITGTHACGRDWKHDILRGEVRLDKLDYLVEAQSLLRSLLALKPGDRPCLSSALTHPFYWPLAKRLQYICDLSDRLKEEGPSSSLLVAFEHSKALVVGKIPWIQRVPQDIERELRRVRFDTTSLQGLARLMRNKRAHFRELSEHLHRELGSTTLSLYMFFLSKWPSLFMACYATGLRYLTQEREFALYFPREAQEAPLCHDIIRMFLPGAVLPRASARLGASHNPGTSMVAGASLPSTSVLPGSVPPGASLLPGTSHEQLNSSAGRVFQAGNGAEKASKSDSKRSLGEGKNARQRRAAEASEHGKTIRREAAAAMQKGARDKHLAAARQVHQECPGLSDNVHCGQCSLILAGPHKLQCCHMFCGSCLDACLGNAMECPICRAEVVKVPEVCTGFLAHMADSRLQLLSDAQRESCKRRIKSWEYIAAEVHLTWEANLASKEEPAQPAQT